MKNQKKAYGFALLAVLCWSTVATAFKISLKYIDIYNFLLYSSLTAVLVLFLVMLIQQKLSLLKISPREIGGSALRGLFNPFVYYLVLFEAYRLLPAQEAQSLNYTWPVVLSIFAVVFLNEKFRWINVVALAVSFFGVLVISLRGNFSSLHFASLKGTLFAVGSSLIWASYWVLNMKSTLEDLPKLFMNFAFGFVYILILVLLLGKFSIPVPKALAGAVYSGVFEMGLTFVLWLKAMQFAEDTAKTSNLIFLSPFTSLFFISLIVGERILPSTVIGLVFIISGILIQQIKFRSSKNA